MIVGTSFRALLLLITFSCAFLFADTSWASPQDTPNLVPENAPLAPLGSGEFKVTGYACPPFCENSLTKTEKPVRIGMVAVDRNIIPLGSVVKIQGLTISNDRQKIFQFPEKTGKFKAEDTGSGVRGFHIDVYVSRDTFIDMGGREISKAFQLTGYYSVSWFSPKSEQ